MYNVSAFRFAVVLFALTAMACHWPVKDSLSVSNKPFADSLSMALNAFSRESLIPGFSVAIVNDKGICYSKGFGYANLQDSIPFTPQTIHGVASISKTFIALALMQLVEQGKLRLDTPVNDILPYRIVNPWFPDKPITLRHLISHTSSIIDDAFVPYYIGEADICMVKDNRKYDSLPAYLQPNLEYYRMGKKISLDEHIRKYTQPGAKWYTDSTFLHKEPGQYFQYSNLGAAVAARIVEWVSGMSFQDFTEKNIFKPLRMQHSTWDISQIDPKSLSVVYAHNNDQVPTGVVEHPYYYMTNFPVSGLHTTATDLGLFLVEMIRGAEGKGKLLGKSAYQTLFQAQQLHCENIDKNNSDDFGGNYDRAVLWPVSATGYRFHFGGNTGVYAFVYFHPERHSGALAICNLRDNSFADVLRIVQRYEQKMSAK